MLRVVERLDVGVDYLCRFVAQSCLCSVRESRTGGFSFRSQRVLVASTVGDERSMVRASYGSPDWVQVPISAAGMDNNEPRQARLDATIWAVLRS